MPVFVEQAGTDGFFENVPDELVLEVCLPIFFFLHF